MASEMWAASGRGEVDGVIAIDVIGLKRLLAIVGPVDVTDGNGSVSTVSADNVAQDLLLDQYRSYASQNDARRERLGRVGSAVFESFNERRFSAYRLLQTLEESGAGRNLMVWSKDPVEEAGWRALGAAGALPQDAMLLSVLNRGGNKLDQFLGVDATMTAVARGDVRRVSVAVTMANRTPPDLPTYVAGPFPSTSAVAGEYIGILALTVPKGAGNATSTGADLYLTGDDGPTRLLSTKVDLLPGASTHRDVRVRPAHVVDTDRGAAVGPDARGDLDRRDPDLDRWRSPDGPPGGSGLNHRSTGPSDPCGGPGYRGVLPRNHHFPSRRVRGTFTACVSVFVPCWWDSHWSPPPCSPSPVPPRPSPTTAPLVRTSAPRPPPTPRR